MATRYDFFVYLGNQGRAVKSPEIMREFRKRPEEYSNVYRLLMELVDEGLVDKTAQGYQVRHTHRSQLLYRLVTYCIANGINYNYLLDRRLAEFLARAMLQTEFSRGDFDLAPRTFKKYVQLLHQYGLLLLHSRKPYRASVPYNLLIANLLQYFGLPVLVKQERESDLAPLLEKELRRFKTLAVQNEPAYRALVEESHPRFIHASLSLEGNPITLPDTVKILKKRIIPKELRDADVKEIQHYRDAVNQAMTDAESRIRLTEQRILDYHFLAMRHRPEIAGEYRAVPVHIKGNPRFAIAEASEIVPLLLKLMRRYETFLEEKRALPSLIAFAAYFHNQFQYIHPFEDGNSRTARLLAFHILRYAGVPILDIPLGLLDRYQGDTKGYRKRNDRALQATLSRVVLYNLKTINERLSA